VSVNVTVHWIVSVNITVIWTVTPYSLVNRYWHFKGTCSFLWDLRHSQ